MKKLKDDTIASTDASHLDFRLYAIGWVTVGKWLAQGTVSYLGGKALGSILGGNEMDSVVKAIGQAVAEIKLFVREELQRQFEVNELRVIESHLQSIRFDLSQFGEVDSSEYDKYMYLTDNATLECSRLANLSASHTLLGLPSLLNATSLYVLALAAQYRAGRRSAKNLALGVITNAEMVFIRIASPHFESWKTENRLSDLMSMEGNVGCGSDGCQYMYWWEYRLDGVQYQLTISFDPGDAVIAQRMYNAVKAKIQNEEALHRDAINNPFADFKVEWVKAYEAMK